MTTMSAAERLAQFHRCTTAEEYFALLDVSYDPQIVAVNRLHILRYFSRELTGIDLTGTEHPDRVLATCRQALERAYQAFTTATALDHRLFKVLQDHAPQAMVPDIAVAVEGKERDR